MKKTIIAATAAAIASAAITAALTSSKPTASAEFADIYSIPCVVSEVTTDRVTIVDRSCPSLTWSFDAAETFGCDPFTVGDDVSAVLWDCGHTADMLDDLVVNVVYDHSRLAQ